MMHMIPDTNDLSDQMSVLSKLSSIRAMGMAPRTATEELMGINLGLMVTMSRPYLSGATYTHLDTMYEVGKDGFIKLKSEYDTEELQKLYNPIDGTEIKAIRLRIMQLYTDIQGNFFKDNNSYISYNAAGKSIELLKRWLTASLLRRYGSTHLDLIKGEEVVPMYTAVANVVKEFTKAAIKADLNQFYDYWSNTATRTPATTRALKSSLAEVILILTAGIVVTMLGYSGDDRNKRLKEMDMLQQYFIAIAVRVQSELGTFIPIPMFGLGAMELKRALLDPTSVVRSTADTIMAIGTLAGYELFDALGANYEKQLIYQKDTGYYLKNKGDRKIYALMASIMGYTGQSLSPAPYIQTIDQMQNRIR